MIVTWVNTKSRLMHQINSRILFRIFFFLILFKFQVNYSQHSKNTDIYKVIIDKDSPKIALVQCHLEIKDSLLYMSAIGANQFPSRWAHFVHDLKAETMNGEHIKIDSMQGAQWLIHSPKGSRIKLSYTVHLDHENFKWDAGIDGAAYARDWGVFYTGRSLFIINGEQKEKLQVSFDISKEWKVSTPWDNAEQSNLKYLVSNQSALLNSIIFAGTHDEYVIKRDDFELVFALGGEDIIKQKESFTSMADGVLDYYIQLMGGVPNPSPDHKFKKSVVVMNSSSQTDGEVIGNNISILLEKDADEMSQMMARFMFAHEFFHLWNGKSFTPQGDDSEWFNEGVTNYYTLKSLFHIGYLNEQTYLGVLNSFFYQRYHNDKGVGKLSLIQGDRKHDHWGLIYCGGFFAGISQDMIIRSSTKNSKSMDDVVRALFEKYGGTNKQYTLAELKQLMSDSSGKDQTVFFDTYISGSKKIPLDYYLNMGGFIAEEAEGNISISTKSDPNQLETEIINGFFGMN